MLQFWVPRTEEFEEAMISNIRTPFLLNEFNLEAEKATIRILQTLSMYEKLEDLSEATIANILLNDALRLKICSVNNVEDQINLIKEELIKENNRIKEEAEKHKQTANELKKLVDSKELEVNSLKSEVDGLRASKQLEENKTKILESKITGIEKKIEAEKKLIIEIKSYEDTKSIYKSNKWEEYQKGKWTIFYFLGLYLLSISTLIFNLNFYPLLTPILSFAISILLSLFSRDKISKSLSLIFKNKRVKSRELKKYEEEFSKSNKYPTINGF